MLKIKSKIFLLVVVMFLFSISGVKAGHVSCGQTIYQDTVLDSDLICPYDGIIMGANGITLDCNGHSISGTGNSNGVGVYLSGRNNNVIENCNIQDFYRGIYLSSGSNFNTLTNNTANSNIWYGIDNCINCVTKFI